MRSKLKRLWLCCLMIIASLAAFAQTPEARVYTINPTSKLIYKSPMQIKTALQPTETFKEAEVRFRIQYCELDSAKRSVVSVVLN